MNNDGTDLIKWDPYLSPYKGALQNRYNKFKEYLTRIEKHQTLDSFSQGYKEFGFNKVNGGIKYKEWAPGAQEAYLIGDFNNWNRQSHKMERDNFGCYHIFIPDINGEPGIPHNSRVKICLKLSDGTMADRIPAWMTYVTQEEDKSYVGRIWMPKEKYQVKSKKPKIPKNLRIYEAHVGMASKEGKVASYAEFERDILPYVVKTGYNCIQLMAIMEHAYYASFGYHVTNFFAPSSRFGTPDDLRRLIDRAHQLGLIVLIDIVHSHASKNVLDGINQFDGTDHQYFHEGGRGYHDLWDSRLFNYGHWEVQRFLLSNLRYWIDELGFDGFRFDGVTSMLYFHHGMGTAFTSYDDYFGPAVDVEAVGYLMLAHHMLSSITTVETSYLSIAEEVSGMPGLCRPVNEGGLGFTSRLGMAIPDMWIRLLKEYRDEEWNMGHLVHTLTNRRYREPVIGYAESHDQALVGDKTIAFWLMDREMYDHMSTLSPLTPVIDRGLALHKMIRLITLMLGGEGYLCFMGNEFGHPEWIDFPREGNGNSYHYCRRQWNLLDDELLRYRYLYRFDQEMMRLDQRHEVLASSHTFVSLKHEQDKIIAFDRGDGLVAVFNFHPTQSFTDYRIGTPWSGTYRVLLCSDDDEFGGHQRIDPNTRYPTQRGPWCNRDHYFQAYLPSRTAIVFIKE